LRERKTARVLWRGGERGKQKNKKADVNLHPIKKRTSAHHQKNRREKRGD